MAPSTAARMDENAYDTEITLGTGKMLALFFGLVILCAVFFGMGFSMGRNSVKSTAELLPSPSQPERSAANRVASTPAPSTTTPTAQTTTAPQTPAVDTTGAVSSQQPASAADQFAQAQAAASQPSAGYFVQVAAVSKQEDAEALVDSLKGHQYQAFIANQPADKLFHVQVGPFTDVKDAEAMRSKLVSDGYNPILKK